MKFVKIEAIPKRGVVKAETRVRNKPLREYLSIFVKRGIKFARVDLDFEEYADEWTAASSIRHAIVASKLPIAMRFRDGQIYLINTNLVTDLSDI